MSPSSLSASLSLEDDNHAVKSSVVGRDDDLPEMDLLVVRPAVPTVTAVEGKGRVKDVQTRSRMTRILYLKEGYNMRKQHKMIPMSATKDK